MADFTESGGVQAARSILSRTVLPTAILGGNDRCAAGILATLARAGVGVPSEVSVAGLDDSSVARLAFIDLITVGYVPSKLSERAVDAMVELLDNPASTRKSRREAPYLIERGSTAAPRADD
ncbi:substrate-binding domain-containing protein [Rothia uropygioeca]|uniref:substrate-binding domain-containing protein n=1 Tax=Kocuria sp. 257 TaxID=2021970 RepID=UPI001010392A|nr:substrate-binding domain-containing protein [Kocuria sp. 257]